MIVSQPTNYESGFMHYAFNKNNGSEDQNRTKENKEASPVAVESEEPDTTNSTERQPASPGSDNNLSDAELKQINKLEKRDLEVKAHERAHIAAGGQFVTSGATFSYQTGPDGKRYATGGEVSISSGKESSPEATIAKMQVIRKAALAPANPSGQDRAVAAEALKAESEARQELNSQKIDSASKTETNEDNIEEDNSIKIAPTTNESASNTGHYNPKHPDIRGSRLDISA